jgi:uncharacterized membrane protein YjjP (DUF1212 family)
MPLAVSETSPDAPASTHAHTVETRFVLELARALHQHGTPAHRLEALLVTVADRLGLVAEFFSTPTSLMVGFGPMDTQRVHLMRVEPGEPNLGHLSRLGAITLGITEGGLTPADGLRQIRELLVEPPRWPRWLTLVAFILASAAVACFLRVFAGDVLVAALLGLVTGGIAMAAATSNAWRHVTEPLAAFIVTTLALTIDVVSHTGTGYATSLAGLVVLLPGLSFTVALAELSTRHLASGTARLSGAVVVFLGLGFGLALGAKLGTWLGVHAALDVPLEGFALLPHTTLPFWSEWVALLVAPLAFMVLLNAEARDAGWIMLASVAAYLTSRLAGTAMGEELGAFLGAFVVSAGSNIIARYFRRSAIVTVVPGLLILVPGSIGFRSVTSLLGQQVEAGVATGFRLLIIGISLAAGLLAGNVIASGSRRRL